MREQHLSHLKPVVRQVPCGRFSNTTRQERRREDDVVPSERRGVDAVGKAEGVCAGGRGRWLAEGLGVGDGLEADDLGERGRVQPRGRNDVGAALFFEKEGKPEGELGALGRLERGGVTL